ncbi:MAG TPA: hypothetical protein DDZ80_18770 [Cyanobacteria bacterium UBA8803]|nr:hypothetical protein [Cyanobacteria bacterium UBA8803]
MLVSSCLTSLPSFLSSPHSFTPSLPHSLTPSLPHSLTPSQPLFRLILHFSRAGKVGLRVN